MHANAIRTLLHAMEYKHITRHGFRSSFRDWANECTHYPREVCEAGNLRMTSATKLKGHTPALTFSINVVH